MLARSGLPGVAQDRPPLSGAGGVLNSYACAGFALFNEAYLQLAGQFDKDWQNRSHFFAVAAIVMRRILVDYARTRKAAKRGGAWQKLELTEALAITEDKLDEILSIDAALDRLAEFDPRRSRVVVLRFFGGMSEEEVARVLNVTPRTIRRDWNVAAPGSTAN